MIFPVSRIEALSPTGRRPSQPRLQHLVELQGKPLPASSQGSTLVDIDFSTLEQRVLASVAQQAGPNASRLKAYRF